MVLRALFTLLPSSAKHISPGSQAVLSKPVNQCNEPIFFRSSLFRQSLPGLSASTTGSGLQTFRRHRQPRQRRPRRGHSSPRRRRPEAGVSATKLPPLVTVTFGPSVTFQPSLVFVGKS
jgi:hypothetical protein